MNEIPKFAAPRTVTTGSITGSRKVYAAPGAAPIFASPFARSRSPIRMRRRCGSTIRLGPTRKAT